MFKVGHENYSCFKSTTSKLTPKKALTEYTWCMLGL